MTPQFPNAVERWPLDRLIPHARNARTHSEEQVAQIAGSIAEFGFVNPILVGDDGVMVAGHGRVLAARKLGLSEVPVIVLSHLTPTQRRALMIADNHIAANAGWNEEMLAAELAALKDEAFDLDLLGFDDAEIDRLLAGSDDETADLDEAPEPPAEPVSRPGDLWICGEHRVLCGDATVLSRCRKGAGRRARRHDVLRSALRRELRQLGQRQTARQEPSDPQRQPRRGFRRAALRRLRQHPHLHQGRDLHLHVVVGTRHGCRRRSARPAASGRPSSSGPRTPSRSGARIISASTSRSSTAGRTAPITTGAAPATRAMSGSSTSRTRTICTRR